MFSGKPNAQDILSAFASINDDAAGLVDSGSFAIRDDSVAGLRLNGQTSFLRHVQLLEPLADTLAGMRRHDAGRLRVLAAPTSIGCEAYTLSAIFRSHAVLKDEAVSIDGFDLSARFTTLARLGCYPARVVHSMHAGWRNRLFSDIQTMHGIAAIRRGVWEKVRFFDPQRFENFVPVQPYDALMMNNLFMYMDKKQMGAAFDVVAACAPRLLVFTNESNELRAAYLKDALFGLGFIGMQDHASGRRSALGGRSQHLYPFYTVMAHKDAVFTPVRAPSGVVLQPQ